MLNLPDATTFSRFLDRLGDTVNAGHQQFQQSMGDWLRQLEKHPALRQNILLLSESATASCEDRVSLTLNAMRQLRLAYDVEQGVYDQRLRERLALPLDTPDMRFFNVSYVTCQARDALDWAQARVMAANEALIEAMGEPFANRLQARLREAGLENDVDAERIVGPQVRAEIEREIKGRLTRDLLDRHRLKIHPRLP